MKRLLPVIHIKDPAQAQEQVAIAVECGADGVWLINHDGYSDVTLKIFERIRYQHKDLWMGVNLLDQTAHVAMRLVTQFSLSSRIDGLWTDKSGAGDSITHNSRETYYVKRDTGWEGQYFGGVAFKGQKPVQDYAKAAKNALQVMDIVCTSGAATAQAADVDKIKIMSRVTGPERLAIASGVTPDNIGDYLPYVDHFLVASGISQDFHTLDPAKVRALAEAIHG